MQAIEDEIQATKAEVLDAELVREKADRRREERAEREQAARELRDHRPTRGRGKITGSQR